MCTHYLWSHDMLPLVTQQGEGGSFEPGDDGIVPSTPTLPVPRRSDGFAEAVRLVDSVGCHRL